MIHSSYSFPAPLPFDYQYGTPDYCGDCFELRPTPPHALPPPPNCLSLPHSVYDVSFGPAGDASCKPRLLLFSPDPSSIRPCTLQSVKKHRREKRNGRTSSPYSSSPTFSVSVSPSPYSPASSPVTCPFSDAISQQILAASSPSSPTYVFPLTDPEWTEFDRAVKLFDLAVLSHSPPPHVNYTNLLHRFKALSLCSEKWHWPVNIGREHTHPGTPVPDVNQAYTFRRANRAVGGAVTHGDIALRAVYQSFLHWNLDENGLDYAPNDDPSTDRLKRLNLFRDLAMGKSLTPRDAFPSFLLSCDLPWESLFDPFSAAQWKEVILHYSSNNVTLFEDSNASIVTPDPPTNMHTHTHTHTYQGYPKDLSRSVLEFDDDEEEEELCSIFRRNNKH